MSRGEEEGRLQSRSEIDEEGMALGGWRPGDSMHGEGKTFATVADSTASKQQGAEHGRGVLGNMCVKYNSMVSLDWRFRGWAKAWKSRLKQKT